MTTLSRLLSRTTWMPDDCWIVQGGNAVKGYVVVGATRNGVYGPVGAHRFSYEYFVGPIPEGMQIDHVCHTRALAAGTCMGGACIHRKCVNPLHLRIATPRENNEAGASVTAAHGQKTHCLRGHAFTPANTGVQLWPDGRYKGRRCKTCDAEMLKARRAAAKLRGEAA